MERFNLGHLANGIPMQYGRQTGESAFLSGMQEGQKIGDLMRQNQMTKRMEEGRGIALSALANPTAKDARSQFASGIATQGDLQGAADIVWPKISGISQDVRDQKMALDKMAEIKDGAEAYTTLTTGIASIPSDNKPLKSESDEGSRVLSKVLQVVNQYMKLMSGAAVTTSEATRLLGALGIPQMASPLIGLEPGKNLESLLANQMQAALNAGVTFNPARVRNELASIANGLRERMNKSAAMLRPISENAYSMAEKSLLEIAPTIIDIVPDNALQTKVSEAQTDASEYAKKIGEFKGIDELNRLLKIAGSEKLATLNANNEALKAAAIARDVLQYQKELAQYTSNLGINASAEGIRMASQEVRDKVALAQAALKRGGPNAAAEAQQHLAGTGFTIKDIAVPALTAEQIKRTTSRNQAIKEKKKKEKPPIKKGEKGVTGKF